MESIVQNKNGKRPSVLSQFKRKVDSWFNGNTGMGMNGIDKTASTAYGKGVMLSQADLDDIYECEGMGGTIIKTYVKDMHRGGVTLSGDVDDYLSDELTRLKFNLHSREATTWSFLYGGGLMVFGIADGAENMEEPLNDSNITTIDSIHVFDRYEASIAEWNIDPDSPDFNTPKTYQISSSIGASFTVHASRTARIDGGLLPNRRKHLNHGWGSSMIQEIYTQLKQLGSGYKNVECIIDDFITGVLSIDGLVDAMSGENEGDNLIQKRMQLLDIGKHIINTLLIDKEEDYEKRASSVAGLGELLDKYILALSAVSNQPVSIMMGQSPSGLNATGDADIRTWYDTVNYEQTVRIEPALQKLLDLLMLKKGSPYGGKIDTGVEIEFVSLWQPTAKENAETEKLHAESMAIYATIGAILTEEIRMDLDKRDVIEIDPKATIIAIPPIPELV